MDAVDLAIMALRLLLVGLLYLFLWLVVRSAWRSLQPRSEASAPQTIVTPSPSSQRNSNLRLLVLEPGASNLPPGGVIEVADGATFGRAERSSIVVADPAVSAEHARLVRTRDEWLIADLGSTNGTLVNQSLVDGEATLEPGDVVGLGNVRLKVVGR